LKFFWYLCFVIWDLIILVLEIWELNKFIFAGLSSRFNPSKMDRSKMALV